MGEHVLSSSEREETVIAAGSTMGIEPPPAKLAAAACPSRAIGEILKKAKIRLWRIHCRHMTVFSNSTTERTKQSRKKQRDITRQQRPGTMRHAYAKSSGPLRAACSVRASLCKGLGVGQSFDTRGLQASTKKE